MSEPHWERGSRCHGFWVDDMTRFAHIGLPPRGFKVDKPYQWSIDLEYRVSVREGSTATLRQAKAAVEKIYREIRRPHR